MNQSRRSEQRNRRLSACVLVNFRVPIHANLPILIGIGCGIGLSYESEVLPRRAHGLTIPSAVKLMARRLAMVIESPEFDPLVVVENTTSSHPVPPAPAGTVISV